jgi:hypothetical protein
MVKEVQLLLNLNVHFHSPRAPIACESPAPPVEDSFDLGLHSRTRLVALDPAGEEAAVARLSMANVGPYGKPDGVLVEGLGGCGSTYAVAVLEARMLGDVLLAACRAPRKQRSNAFSEASHELLIQLCTTLGLTLAPPGAGFPIRQALRLCAFEGGWLHQQALALIALPRPAPFEHDGRERGESMCASRDRRVSRGEEDEMVQVGTRQAQGVSLASKADPRLPAQRLLALVTSGLLAGDEDLQLGMIERAVCIGIERHQRSSERSEISILTWKPSKVMSIRPTSCHE